ncbi:hypothetical protein [Pedobacter cryoconitis]|uniref:Peptidase M23-like protein n=1 Tax=Pedobacter cryoconitis TaxID=188932 RepID=A0A7X0J536_9SPHI|nr:hypothetical protein [Pedobacter cryoconitis]MBB6501030.1 hypothetical protein [Pedobacter cryoconitis]
MISKTKIVMLCASLGLGVLKVNAQENLITVASKTNKERGVEINYEKNVPGTYTLILKFNTLNNSSGAKEKSYTLKSSSGSLVTLSPINKEQNIEYSFNYSYIKGKLNPKYNSNFSYILPYKNGTKTQIAEVGFIGEAYFGGTTAEDWKVYRFYTKQADSIAAVRKGIVVEVRDLYEPEASAGLTYSDKINELTIEHADGTLATYRGFKKGSFVVRQGQTVFPGTTLGLNTKETGSDLFGVNLLITYLKSVDFEGMKNRSIQSSKSFYGFVAPHFYTVGNADTVLTAQQEYVVADTPEIRTQEFTKKELKQLIR